MSNDAIGFLTLCGIIVGLGFLAVILAKRKEKRDEYRDDNT